MQDNSRTDEQKVILEQYRELRGCKNKRTYYDKPTAKKEAKRMTQTHHNGRMRAYSCRYCGHYHVGHNKFAKAEDPVSLQSFVQ